MAAAAAELCSQLPPNWDYCVTADGRVFFVDDRREVSTWLHPVTRRPVQSGLLSDTDLPDGWEWNVTPEGIIYYVDHIKQQTTFIHPLTGKPAALKSVQGSVSSAQSQSSSNQSSKASSKKAAGRQSKIIDQHPSAQRTNSSKVFFKGWLYTLAGNSSARSWKRQWCVLADYGLFFYKDDVEMQCVGSILLPSYHISACDTSDPVNKRFAFKAEHANMKTHFLAADCQDDMEQWIKVLNESAQMQRPHMDSRHDYALKENNQPDGSDGRLAGGEFLSNKYYSQQSYLDYSPNASQCGRESYEESIARNQERNSILENAHDISDLKHPKRSGNPLIDGSYRYDSNISDWNDRVASYSHQKPDGKAESSQHVKSLYEYQYKTDHLKDDEYYSRHEQSDLSKNCRPNSLGSAHNLSYQERETKHASWNEEKHSLNQSKLTYKDSSDIANLNHSRSHVNSSRDYPVADHPDYSSNENNYHSYNRFDRDSWSVHSSQNQTDMKYDSDGRLPFSESSDLSPLQQTLPAGEHKQYNTYVDVPGGELDTHSTEPHRPVPPQEITGGLTGSLAQNRIQSASNSTNELARNSSMLKHEDPYLQQPILADYVGDNEVSFNKQMSQRRVQKESRAASTNFRTERRWSDDDAYRTVATSNKDVAADAGMFQVDYTQAKNAAVESRERAMMDSFRQDLQNRTSSVVSIHHNSSYSLNEPDLYKNPEEKYEHFNRPFRSHSNLHLLETGQSEDNRSYSEQQWNRDASIDTSSAHTNTNLQGKIPSHSESDLYRQLLRRKGKEISGNSQNYDQSQPYVSGHNRHQKQLPNYSEMHTVKEDPSMPDTDIIETKQIPKSVLSTTSGRLRMSISAGDLLGKTHEELVLLLIQLHRNKAGLEYARDFYRQKMDELDAYEQEYRRLHRDPTNLLDSHLEAQHRQYMEFKRNCEEIENKLEVYKPLVNLVDNMVTMGSLYGGDNYMLATQYRKNLLHPDQYTAPRKMLEFSRRHQEEKIVQEIDREVKQLQINNNADLLEEKLERLCVLDRAIQEQSFMVTSLTEDLELLEKALKGVRKQQEKNRDNPRELDHLSHQQRTIEKELSRVKQQLAEASKKLEEKNAESSKLEHEVALLRSKVHSELNQSRSAHTLFQAEDPAKTRHKMEKDLFRVQTMMHGLTREGARLSEAMSSLKSPPTEKLPMLDADNYSKKDKSSTYMETDLDSSVTKDLGRGDNLYSSLPLSSSWSDQPVSHASNSLLFSPATYLDSGDQLLAEQAQQSTLQPELGSNDHNVEQVNNNNDDQTADTKGEPKYDEYLDGPWDISDADDNTKRFFGLIPKDKPRMQTVRDVKRQAEQRRERDKFRGREDGERDSDTDSWPPCYSDAVSNRLQPAVYSNKSEGGLSFMSQEGTRSDPATRTEAPALSRCEHTEPDSGATNQEDVPDRSQNSLVSPNSTSSPNLVTQALTFRSSLQPLPARLLGPKPFTPYQSVTPTTRFDDKELPVKTVSPLSCTSSVSTTSLLTTRPVVTSYSKASLLAPKPWVKGGSLPSSSGIFNVKKSPRGRYMTISSSQPVRLEQSLFRQTSLNTAAGDLITSNSIEDMPDIIRSSTSKVNRIDEMTIDRELSHPEKVLIPERYNPDSDEEDLTEEDKERRREKAEKIKKVLTNQSVHSWTKPVSENQQGGIHAHVRKEKLKREQLLKVSQELAKEVTLRSKQAADHDNLKNRRKGGVTWSHPIASDAQLQASCLFYEANKGKMLRTQAIVLPSATGSEQSGHSQKYRRASYPLVQKTGDRKTLTPDIINLVFEGHIKNLMKIPTYQTKKISVTENHPKLSSAVPSRLGVRTSCIPYKPLNDKLVETSTISRTNKKKLQKPSPHKQTKLGIASLRRLQHPPCFESISCHPSHDKNRLRGSQSMQPRKLGHRGTRLVAQKQLEQLGFPQTVQDQTFVFCVHSQPAACQWLSHNQTLMQTDETTGHSISDQRQTAAARLEDLLIQELATSSCTE